MGGLLFLESDRVILFDGGFVGDDGDEGFVAVESAVLHGVWVTS